MTQVNIDEIKRNFPIYLQRVESGETIIIVESGKPIAELRPTSSLNANKRPFGLCAGEFTVPDNFDEPLPDEFIDEFEGK